MSKEIGTLAIVVLKAQNLNDIHSFSKQDAYGQLSLNGTVKRTPVEKRAGQHPMWDAEIRFPIMKDTAEKYRMLEVSCWADEPRDDVLLGQAKLDISETLQTGEFDDWVKLHIDGTYRGEIYLEMTFYASTPSPAGISRRPSKLAPDTRLQRPTQPYTYSIGPKTHSPQGSASSSPSQSQMQYKPPQKGGRLVPSTGSPASSSPSSRSSSASPGHGRHAELPPVPEEFPSALAPGKPKPVGGEVPAFLRPGKPTPSDSTPRPRVVSTPPLTLQTAPTQAHSPSPYSPVTAKPYQPVTGKEARISSTSANIAPYPPTNVTLYPPVNATPYPPANTTPYPPNPYPTANTNPYPPGNSTPYSPTHANPYPLPNTAPYPPASTNPYPPTNTTPYRPATTTPYPPAPSYEPTPPVSFPVPQAAPGSYSPPSNYRSPYQSKPAPGSDLPDPYLSARYQAPLPLPGSPPGPPAPSVTSVSSRVLEEAARRKEQEEKDLELARQLDRELNM